MNVIFVQMSNGRIHALPCPEEVEAEYWNSYSLCETMKKAAGFVEDEDGKLVNLNHIVSMWDGELEEGEIP